MQKGPEHQTFEFFSGGAYHVEGYGEWTVKVGTEGAFSVTHNIRGEVTDYGAFILAEQENLELWKLIRAIHIEDIEPSDRPGRPDEVRYSFLLRDNGQTHSVSMWVDDAREEEGIAVLVERLATLIEKVTGEAPVLH